jgi:DnaJ-class molecular chaperone
MTQRPSGYGAERMSATSDDPRATCTPCRGTGKLVSGLGGNPHEVTCPWCGGTGGFQPGRDAQRSGPADDVKAG